MVTITLLQTFPGQCCWKSNLILPSGKQHQPFVLWYSWFSRIVNCFVFNKFLIQFVFLQLARWSHKAVEIKMCQKLELYQHQSLFQLSLCFLVLYTCVFHPLLHTTVLHPAVQSPVLTLPQFQCQILLLFSCCFPVHSVYWNDPFHCSPLPDSVFGHHGRFSTYSWRKYNI